MNDIKKYYANDHVRQFMNTIIRQTCLDRFYPDYIVGIVRGGLIPATYFSHYFNVPLKTLNISLRDGSECESAPSIANEALNGKNILIVDDINDTGSTLKWLMNDWESYGNVGKIWWQENVWGKNVKTAVLIDNAVSLVDVDYSGTTINKLENPEWCVFPWEHW